MSAVNTTVNRGTAVRQRTTSGGPVSGRVQADRGRPVGSTGLADADQRGRGIFGFPQGPQSGGILQRLGRRPGPDQPAATTPAAPTAPLTGLPLADPEALARTAGGLTAAGVPPTENVLDFLGTTATPGGLATIDQSVTDANAINEILGRARGTLAGFEPGGGAVGSALTDSLIGTLENPEAISEAVQQAAISKATDSILGSRRTDQQRLQESFAARGISDSGLSFALSQAGRESASRDIAGVERDVLLQAGLAQSQREAQAQALAANVSGNRDALALARTQGLTEIDLQTAFPTVDIAGMAAGQDLDAAFNAVEDEDADRQFGDFLSTNLGGIVAFAVGQAMRAGKPGLAAIIGALGLGGAARIANRET